MRPKCALIVLAVTFGFTASVYAQPSEETEVAVLRATVQALQAEVKLLKLRIDYLESRFDIAKTNDANEYILVFPGTEIRVDFSPIKEYLAIQGDTYDRANMRYVLTVKVKKDMNFNEILAVTRHRLVLLDSAGVMLTRVLGELEPALAFMKAEKGEVHRLMYHFTPEHLENCEKIELK